MDPASIAGIVSGTFGLTEVLERKVRRWIGTRSPRIKAKMRAFINGLLESTPGKTMRKLLQPASKGTISLAKDINMMLHPSGIIRSNPTMEEHIQHVLSVCSFRRPIPFWLAIPHWKQALAKKISEGAYGEVFKSIRLCGDPVIIKLFPVGGKHPDHFTAHLTFRDISSEVVSSVKLSNLADADRSAQFRSPNFPKCYRISCVQGKYPRRLLQAWQEYSVENVNQSEHPRPDRYCDDQLVIAIESEFCGQHVSPKEIRTARRALSLITQIAASLAVAEKAYEFEHRDLHIGNILINETQSELLEYAIDGMKFSVASCGVKATIIDFTLARIRTGEDVFFVDMSGSAWYSRGDERAPSNPWIDNKNIYRVMSEWSGDTWSSHHPFTNIVWLRYLIENIVNMIGCLHEVGLLERDLLDILRDYQDCTLFYDSAAAFTFGKLFPCSPLITVHNPNEPMS